MQHSLTIIIFREIAEDTVYWLDQSCKTRLLFFFMCLDNDDEFNVLFLAFICLNTWKTYKAQIYRAEDI